MRNPALRNVESPDPYNLPPVPYRAPRGHGSPDRTAAQQRARILTALDELARAGGYQRPPYDEQDRREQSIPKR